MFLCTYKESYLRVYYGLVKRLQYGFCTWESMKTEIYSSTRHRKKKQKKHLEVLLNWQNAS